MFKRLDKIVVPLRKYRLGISWTLLLIIVVEHSSADSAGDFHIRRILSTSKYNPIAARHYGFKVDAVNLKSYIKSVLDVEQTNHNLDSAMSNAFNIDNPNPMYVFLLPGELHNRTLVLRRSDFGHAIFPNISSLQRHIMAANISRLYTLIENLDKNNPTWMSQQLQPLATETISYTADNAPSNDDDQDDAKSMKVVEENVRTERNFFKFMHYLNDNKFSIDKMYNGRGDMLPSGSALISRFKKYKSSQSQIEYSLHIDYTTAKPIGDGLQPVVSWKDLGLDGWIGGIKEPGKDFSYHKSNEPTKISKYHTTQRYRPTSYTPNVSAKQEQVHHSPKEPSTETTKGSFSVIYENLSPKINFRSSYTPYSFQVPTTVDNVDPYHTGLHIESSTLPMHHQDSWDVPMKIPNALNELLKEENFQNSNITGFLRKSKPKWPVTSSRASHKDEDVFIARANNPFGHSTKWKWSNATDADSNENRSKRGALILYSMVKCSTGCDPLVYKGYGCYCGFLGSGRTLDGIDRCCKMHDFCYETAKCPMFLEYFVPYLWKCYRGRPLCAIDHGEWGGPGSCAARLCECDQTLSKCLRRFYCPRKRAVCSSSPWRLLQNVIMV